MIQSKDIINLINNSQIYLDMTLTSTNGLHHIASISDKENDLQSIGSTIGYVLDRMSECNSLHGCKKELPIHQLRKLFNEYSKGS